MALFTYPNAFAPVKADGTPNRPDLGQANVLVKELMNAVQMALFDGLIYSTRAALYADLAHAANSWALVIGDPTSGYDGLYQKSGASGSGSWSRKGDVPGSGFIQGTDSGAGTPNAILVTSPAIPATDGAALISFNVFEANTSSPVTVRFNGGTALTIKDNAGDDVQAGALKAGMIVTGFTSGSTFRLINIFGGEFLLATNVSGTNAIVATTPTPIPGTDGAALITLPISITNTGSTTVAFNGGSALTIKDATGSNMQAGSLKAGMLVTGYKSGSTFQLINIFGPQFLLATNVSGTNAIVATTATPIPTTAGQALVVLPISITNTATPVTVAFNSGSALTIKDAAGNDIDIGTLKAGSVALGYVSGSTFRLTQSFGAQFVTATNSGAGTANAIQATTADPFSATDGAALIVFNVTADNTASPVTVAFNGGTALTIKTSSGNDVPIGGLVSGMMVLGFKSGSTFRLLTDQASAAIIAVAEAAQVAAEDARDEAEALADSVSAALAAALGQGAVYETIADVEAAVIDGSIDAVAARGYYAAGDTENYIFLERFTGKGPGTNLLRCSNLLTNSVWTASALTATAKSAAMRYGVDGYFTSLVPSTSSTVHQFLQAVSFTSGLPYVASLKAKANGYNYIRIQLPTAAFGASQLANFNISTGTVSSTAGSVTAGVESLGGGEYLIWVKGTATTTVSANATYQVLNNSATATYAGDGTSGVLVAEFQIDQADALTEYVKTHNDAVTRRIVNGYVTSGDGARWRYSLGQQLTTKKFGAKADAVDTGSAFSGTDDTAAVADAIGFAAQFNREVFISAGNHNIVITNQVGTTGYTIYVGYHRVRINGFGSQSVIFLNEDVTYYLNYGPGVGRCLGSGISTSGYPKDYWELFSIRNLKFKGRFSHTPGRYGTFPFWVENFARVQQDNVHYEDIRSGCTNTKYGSYYSATNCRAVRIGAGALARPIEFDSVYINNNYAFCTDDDVIDASTGPAAIATLYPVRQGAVITNNIFIQTESVLCWGFRTGNISNNIMIRPHGGPIQVGYEEDQAGVGAANGLIVSDNMIVDPLGRYDFDPDYINYDSQSGNFKVGATARGVTSGATGTIRDDVDSGTTGKLYLVNITGTFQDNETITDDLSGSALVNGTLVSGAGWRWYAQTSPAILMAGSHKSSTLTTNAVIPGEYDSTAGAFLLPYTNQGSIPEWGAMNAGPSSVVASGGAVANKMTGNIVIRTLPTVSKYSDWGYGQYFNGFDGFQDPAVTDDAFRTIGLGLWSGIRNVMVKDNITFGMATAGMEFLIPGVFTGDRQKAFQDIWITGNQFIWSKRGITKDNIATGGTFGDWDRWGVHIYDNLFDLDPFHQASIRNTDGSWDSDSGNDYRGINIMRLNGVSIGRNTFRNCYAPLKYDTDYTLHGAFFRNIVECDPAATGFNTGNKGVGYIERACEAFLYQIFVSDPTVGATFRDFKNACVTTASSIPTSGTYVAGHFVQNSNPSISGGKVLWGWLRLTTGTGHVANTDWVALYMTNS